MKALPGLKKNKIFIALKLAVLTAMNMKIVAFWEVTRCILVEKYQYFR
jgi:hypothetical protein